MTTGDKFNRIPDLVRELQYLASHHVEIGIFADASRDEAVPMLVIAAANEFGAKIPKRQARLDNPEKWIIIPERSYLRAWFDENVDALQVTLERLIGQIVEGKISGRAALEMIGGYVVTHVQAYMIDLKTPPNVPSTIARKGSSNPLIDTGQLKDAITWRVVGAK